MRILFFYKYSQRTYGSIYMRVRQIKQIINENSDISNAICKSLPISSILPNSTYRLLINKADVFIFSKEAVKLSSPLINIKNSDLKYSSKKIGADILDMETRPSIVKQLDFIVSSSRSQTEYFTTLAPEIPIVFLKHHADLRIPNDIPNPKQKKIAYFGAPENFKKNKLGSHEIDFLEVKRDEISTDFLKLALNYEFHLCTRPLNQLSSNNLHKPPTKIITAAYMNAIPIVDEADGNALDVLGNDYPFIINSDNKNLDKITALISCGKGTKEYCEAQQKISQIRRQYHPREILKEFVNGIRQL